MFIEKTGDLFGVSAPALAHGVNCKGLMGAGIAKPFKDKFPLMYEEYALWCEKGQLRPGRMFPYYAGQGRWVYNIASQDFPGANAKARWLSMGLRDAFMHARVFGVSEIAVPQIGCGIGGLDYRKDVEPIFERLSDIFPMVDLTLVTLP